MLDVTEKQLYEAVAIYKGIYGDKPIAIDKLEQIIKTLKEK